MMGFISIIIITYNRPDDTLALLQNLKEQEGLNNCVKEILLLNNASTVQYNHVVDFIFDNKDLPIEYINSKENMGVARGRNFLIAKAQNPYLLVLDDDVVFENSNSIQKLSTLWNKKLFKENNTAIITLNIFYYSTKQRQINAFPHKDYNAYKNENEFLTYYFTGAAHLMRKDLFEKTGYYPEDFFYGMEEYDLSYRVINAGYSLGFDNSVKIFHKESPVGRVSNKQKLSMMWVNKSKVAYRYLPVKYFYSTAFMWSMFYLQKTKFDFKGWANAWKLIFFIPKNEEKQLINKYALEYLKNVKARLWY